MPISGNSELTPIAPQDPFIPLQIQNNATAAMGALLQTRNTSQSLTTFSFTPADIVSPVFPARASSAPTINQPESAQLPYVPYDSLPLLPKHAAISMYENLVMADDKDIAAASCSRVPSDNTNSYLADVSSTYEQSAAQHFARDRSLPGAQRNLLHNLPEAASNRHRPSFPADTIVQTGSGNYFAEIKFDILYNTTASATDKRNELVKLCELASAGKKVDLSGVNLQQVDLSDLAMNGFILDAVNFTGCNMTKTQLQGASLVGAVFGNAILQETNLSQSDLTFASVEKTVMTDAVMDKVKIRGAKMSDAQLPKNITLKLPDDYLKNGVPDSAYFKQVTEAAYSLGKLDKKTRQSLYNQLWTSIQELGNEEFYEAHRSVLIDAQVKDTDPSPGGDGKGSIYQMIWETIRP